MFPDHAFVNTVGEWVTRLDWGCNPDPSGRAQAAHKDYKKV